VPSHRRRGVVLTPVPIRAARPYPRNIRAVHIRAITHISATEYHIASSRRGVRPPKDITMKWKLGFSLALAIMAVAPASQSGRATWYEYNYLDAIGDPVGSYTVPCVGRPVIEGTVTDVLVFSFGGSCI
jgi:hypothetical protein